MCLTLNSAEWLSIATLTTFFGGVAYAVSGSPKEKTGTRRPNVVCGDKGSDQFVAQLKKELPPIEASGSDEESFILYAIIHEILQTLLLT